MRTPPRSSACTAGWRSRPSNADPRSGGRGTLNSAATSPGNRCHAYGAGSCQLGYRLRASTPGQRASSSAPRLIKSSAPQFLGSSAATANNNRLTRVLRHRFKWQSRLKWQKRPRIAIPGGIALRVGACLPSHKSTNRQTNRYSDTEGTPAPAAQPSSAHATTKRPYLHAKRLGPRVHRKREHCGARGPESPLRRSSARSLNDYSAGSPRNSSSSARAA